MDRQANNNHTSELKRSAFHSIHGLRAIMHYASLNILSANLRCCYPASQLKKAERLTVFAGANVKSVKTLKTKKILKINIIILFIDDFTKTEILKQKVFE